VGTVDVHGNGTQCSPPSSACEMHTDNCDPVAMCVDTPTGFACKCPGNTFDVNKDGTKCTTGDSCAMPTVVDPKTLPVAVAGNTQDGGAHYGFGQGACPGSSKANGAASKDKVYSLTPLTTGNYEIRLTAAFDSVLYVVSDCASIASSCVAAVDLACTN